MGEWIKQSEQRPFVGQVVVVCAMSYIGIEIHPCAALYGGGNEYLTLIYPETLLDKVTHWMPLPLPPKAEIHNVKLD